MSIIILKPNQGHISYTKAAEVFQNLYQKVTGKEIVVTETDDGVSDLIVIGSDSVNDFLMNEVLELRLDSLGIRYGTDDYCIRSYLQKKRKVLILAGGRGRSTLYAVYDYFERYADCHYFWDGDIIPHSDTLPMENINIVESPRFFYRGLRYFAHRGLKRFQAEHWSFNDWKREIDWLTKKRLNFFMLRIGMDDIWQRAFPDDVPYPQDFNTVTGIDAEGYNNRTDFWTLEYRGQLKIKVLEYARDMDLIYPVDCGTMTHWYSRTPQSFLENRKPTFCKQEVPNYTDSDTGRVFDFTKKENMDYYMHLTETMVNEHEKDSALFHTIGLGERRMFEDKNKNFALKQIAYRRVTENIRQRYPNSKLMLASWDFVGWWSPEEVQNLVKELDPDRTIILDYTSEGNDPDNSFMNWGIVGKFPWIFGLFHAYESESELRGPYNRSDERLKIAADDPFCKGMILWPELSHSDPLILEYLSQNAWSPLSKTVEEITERFCQNRYGTFANQMNTCWQQMLPFIKLGDWGGWSQRSPEDEKFLEYSSLWYAHQDIWTKPLRFMKNGETAHCISYYDHKIAQTAPTLPDAVDAIKKLSAHRNALNDPFVLRDAVDMTRTLLGRMLNFLLIKALAANGDTEKIKELKNDYLEMLEIMKQLLSLNSDFSVYQTLLDMKATAPTNPDFEPVLKMNICNQYCSQPAYELVAFLCKDEANAYFDYLMAKENDKVYDFDAKYNEIFEQFNKTRLEDMQPTTIPKPDEIILKAALCVERIKKWL